MRADGANVHGWGERCAEYTGLATGISSHHVPTALQRQKHQRPHTHGSMLPWSTLMQAPTTHLLIYIQIRLMLWSGEGRRASVFGGGGGLQVACGGAHTSEGTGSGLHELLAWLGARKAFMCHKELKMYAPCRPRCPEPARADALQARGGRCTESET